MFCANSRVLSRLAAAVAEESPWEPRDDRGVERGVTLGRGVEGVVLVLAIEASVWTRELRRGVVREGVCEGVEEMRGEELGTARAGETELREEAS